MVRLANCFCQLAGAESKRHGEFTGNSIEERRHRDDHLEYGISVVCRWSNGGSSLPVTGFGDQATPFGLIVLAVLVVGTALFGVSRYLNQRLTSK